MATPKDILVTTTSSLEGLKIKQYLKPVSAHIVAGTNLFSDFFASFSDVFGGRSQTYQKQLRSLYNDAIDRIRYAAYELGANAVVGLSIDMDEVSGKGKSMFMLTAIGTAVILDKEVSIKGVLVQTNEKLENVGVEKIDSLRKKKEILDSAEAEKLNLDENVWAFITANQVQEIFPYLVKKYKEPIAYQQTSPESANKFHRLLATYVDSLPENTKKDLIYSAITAASEPDLLSRLCDIIEELHLLDFDKVVQLFGDSDFSKRKTALRILKFDKPFYNKQDIEILQSIKKIVQDTFTERGTRTTKKQMLSSKEKEVWNCECGKQNIDFDDICNSCFKDIYGFLRGDTKPKTVLTLIDEKIEFILECVE